jgi:hypothetical protein
MDGLETAKAGNEFLIHAFIHNDIHIGVNNGLRGDTTLGVVFKKTILGNLRDNETVLVRVTGDENLQGVLPVTSDTDTGIPHVVHKLITHIGEFLRFLKEHFTAFLFKPGRSIGLQKLFKKLCIHIPCNFNHIKDNKSLLYLTQKIASSFHLRKELAKQ